MRSKTLLTKTAKIGNKDYNEIDEMDVRTARGKKTSNIHHKMEAASRKVRYAGKHININEVEED